MNEFKYTMTNDVVTVSDGGRVHTVRRGAPNFTALRAAIEARDWAQARAHLTSKASVAAWSSGRFTIEGDEVLHAGQPVPPELARRVREFSSRNGDAEPFLRFFDRLALNPSRRSVEQLPNFLKNTGIPILRNGRIMAYKGVTSDYRDVHSTTCTDKNCGHHTYDNRPGNTHEMPRNLISDDPNVSCHHGFHVGAYQYALTFGAMAQISGSRVVVVVVDPADVVCVPNDYSCQKMRVCRYSVVGHYGEPLLTDLVEPPEEAEVRDDEFGDVPSADRLLALSVDDLRALARRMRIVGAASMTSRVVLARAIRAAVEGNGK